MFYILFIFYFSFFCWLITRISFFKKSGLTNQLLIALFIVRILFMLVSCYVNFYILPVSDSVNFHQQGTEEFNLLFTNPHEYILNIFHNPYTHGYSRIFEDYHSFWNNLRTILIAKMISLFDIFSFKNFWINALFFNFLVFFGCVALYKIFNRVFPKATFQLIFCIFLFPSALFFTSVIHRDGLILLAVSMIIYHFYFLTTSEKNSVKRILLVILFMILIFLLRNFIFLALIPALIAWWIASRFPNKAFLSFVIVYSISVMVFFTSGFISPKANFPVFVANRQASFIELGKQAGSSFEVKQLQPSLKSFFNNAPQAFNLAFMRPYLSEIRSLSFAPFAFEIFLLEVLFVLLLFFHKKNIGVPPVIYFIIFFSLTALMMAGYVVPILGAIIRYRSIYFAFLLIPLTCFIDWQSIGRFLKISRK